MAEIDLSVLYSEVFGVIAPELRPNFDPVPSKKSASANVPLNFDVPLRKEKGLYGADFYAQAATGREYYLPVYIGYTKVQKTGGQSGITGRISGTMTAAAATEDTYQEELTIAMPHPITSIRNRKYLVQTPLTERDGDVIEMTGSGNYEITIKGFCVGNREYPEAELKQLRDLFVCGETVKITSALTDLFLYETGRYAVVQDFEILPYPGKKYVRPYELRLISDAIFSLVEI
jgi:hypothetical protein